MINIEKQLILVRTAYLKITNPLYIKQFRLKLAVACFYDKKWYEAHLHRIDVLSSMIEHAMTENNPRRASCYLCLLYNEINQLVEKVDIDYKKPVSSGGKTKNIRSTKAYK